jgi:hypothetical protein
VNARERLNYEVEARVRRIATSWFAGADAQLTPKTSIGLSGGRADVDFDQDDVFLGMPLRQVLQRRTDRISGSLKIHVTRLTSVTLDGESEFDRFKTSPHRDARSVRVLPGLEFRPAARIRGRVRAGYRWFDPLNNQLAGFGSVIGSADALVPVGVATGLRIGLTRDLDYSLEAAQPVYVITAVRAGLVQRFGERWDLEAAISHHRLNYRSLARPEPSVGSRTWVDHGDGYLARLGFVVSRHTRVGVDFEYFRRRAVVRERQFEGLRLVSSVKYGFPG